MSSLGFNFLPWVGLTMGEAKYTVFCSLEQQKSNICNRIRVSESTVEHTPPQILHKYMICTPPSSPPPHTHTHPPNIDYQNLSIAIGDGKKGRGFIL